MKISNSKLRRIIKEELQLEVMGMSDPDIRRHPNLASAHPIQPGARAQESMELSEMKRGITDAIEYGNRIHESVIIDTRQEAINDFAFLYTEALVQQRADIIRANPDIRGWDDLSQDKKAEIKQSAARDALERYKATHTNTELLGDYIARIERIIGKPVPPTIKQLTI